MKRTLLVMAASFAAAAGLYAAVVVPPDGKENPLGAPVPARPGATQVPAPKEPFPGDLEPARPPEPLPTSATPAAQPAPWESKPSEYNSAPLVRVDVLMASVPEAQALPLIQQLRDPAQAEAAEKKLIAMVANKEANLEGWPHITTHSQVRAVSESIVEQRYPIDFLPAASTPSPAPSAPAPAKRYPRGVDEAVALAQNNSGIVPTTFETRNTGATLEVDPVVSPDRTAITLSLSSQLVRLERYADFPAGTTDKGEKLTVSQPIFTTSKISTTLSLRDGERRLIHVGKATEDRSRIDLFIVGAKISAPPAGAR